MKTTTITPDGLRAARSRAGITRAELARRADCSMTFIANCEHGYVPKRSPTLERVRAVLASIEYEIPL